MSVYPLSLLSFQPCHIIIIMFAVIVQNTLETCYGDSFAEATASVSKTTQLLVIAVGLNCLVRILLHATCMWRYLLEVLSR